MANRFLKQDWVEVWLGARDLRAADEFAVRVHKYHRKRNTREAFNNTSNDTESLRRDKMGFRGQYAFAVWARCDQEKFRDQKSWTVGTKQIDFQFGKYGVDVRTTKPSGSLIVHDSDPDNRIIVKVENIWPEDYFAIPFWIYARDGKQKEFMRDGEGGVRPAYFVPDMEMRDANHMLTFPPVLAGLIRI